MAKRVSIEFEGRTYIWDGRQWYDAKSFEKPPQVVIHQLNVLLGKQIAKDDLEITEVKQLLKEAAVAREAQQYQRAEMFARRALKIEPSNPAGLAVLCATLRARGNPELAIAETDEFQNMNHSPLLTTRAAALCDLRRWEEAKREVGRALAIGSSEEAFAVVRRIKSAAPELYDS